MKDMLMGQIQAFSIKLRNQYGFHSDAMRLTLLMLVVRRMECLLALRFPLLEYVYNSNKDIYDEEELDKLMLDQAGLPFYRKSPSTLYSLCKSGYITGIIGVEHYLDDYDKGTREQLYSCGLISILGRTSSNSMLYDIIQTANTWSLGEDLDNHEFMDLVEEVIHDYASSDVSMSGFCTPMGLSQTIASLVVSPTGGASYNTLYDPACGTGSLLRTVARSMERNGLTPDLFGQEIYSFGSFSNLVAKASMRYNEQYYIANTLVNDMTKDLKFDCIVSDLPLGGTLTESLKVSSLSNLPKTTNLNTLFVHHILDKLTPNGRAVFTVAPGLFYAENIAIANTRRWMLDNDVIDAVILLPAGILPATGIEVCICIIDMNKSAERKGKLQIINASDFFYNTGRNKAMIRPDAMQAIRHAYESMIECKYSHIVDIESLSQFSVDVLQPLRDENGVLVYKEGGKVYDTKKTVEVRVPSGEKDFLGYVKKNVLVHLDPESEIDYTTLDTICSIDLKAPFAEEKNEQPIEQLESEAKKIEKDIRILFKEIFEGEETYYVSEEIHENPRTCLFNAIASVSHSRGSQSSLTMIENDNPILSASYLRDGNTDKMKYATDTGDYVYAHAGDIVIVSSGDNAGEVLLSRDGYLAPNLLKVEISASFIDQEFFYLLLKSTEPALRKLACGSSAKNLRTSELGALQLNIPSSDTQQQIVNRVFSKIQSIDQLLPLLGGEAKETIHRYRQALINDAINNKK